MTTWNVPRNKRTLFKILQSRHNLDEILAATYGKVGTEKGLMVITYEGLFFLKNHDVMMDGRHYGRSKKIFWVNVVEVSSKKPGLVILRVKTYSRGKVRVNKEGELKTSNRKIKILEAFLENHNNFKEKKAMFHQLILDTWNARKGDEEEL